MSLLLVLALLLCIPTAALAQATITGSARSDRGEPVSGVSVEAKSHSPVEMVRTTVTDERGRYTLAGLRPGTYAVTFTYPGLQPYVQQGIDLTGSSMVMVNAEMTVAPVTETVVVTSTVPLLHVMAAAREAVMTGEDVQSIPAALSYNALVALIPGVVTNANDTVTGTAAAQFPIHGGRATEGRLMLDGLNIGSPPNGNSATNYSADVGNVQEVTFSQGGFGESETAGLVMNIVPQTGSNEVHGSVFAGWSASALQSDNLTAALTAQGLTGATPFNRLYDIWGAVGGPIVKDRLWYFLNAHTGATRKQVANVYYNLNAGDPTRWLYAPDFNRPEYSDRTFENGSGRVTWQVTRRNRVGLFWDAQVVCRVCTGATPGLSEPAQVTPEAVGVLGRPLHVSQVTWSSQLTDRLFVEAGFGGTFFGVGNFERSPNPTRDLVRVTEQCADGCAANGGVPGLVYRSQDFSRAYTGSYLWKGSLSYGSGTRSLKIGYQHTLMTDDRTWMTNTQNLAYRLNNGSPNQLTESISPWVNNARAGWDAVFAEERWTPGRLTLQGAVRFDRAHSWFPAQQEGPSRFLPTPIAIPEATGVDSYKDITPRFGLTYDLLGNGRAALRLSLGKYLEGVGVSGIYANTNPTLRMPQTTSLLGTAGVTRAWTDANANFTPDCDLLNPAAQDLRSAGGDLCGVMSNTNFGRNILTNSFDPGILNGWGIRPSDWNFALSLQYEVVPRASIEVAYNRRWYDGFWVVDNRVLDPADLTPFSLVAPTDSRLPGNGGYVISGLYDVVTEKAGLVDNFITDSKRYGAWYQNFNGVDVTASVRTPVGLTVIGGASTGQSVADNCDVRAHLPELDTTAIGASTFGAGLMGSAVTRLSPYCHTSTGFQTQFRGLASYPVPKAEFQIAATFQSKPGALLAANYAVPASVVAEALGRAPSGNAPNVTVNLLAPGSMYGDRITQLDWRIAKRFTHGGSRLTVALDIFNALNSSAALTYDNTFVPDAAWPRPLTVLAPRFFKITTELNF